MDVQLFMDKKWLNYNKTEEWPVEFSHMRVFWLFVWWCACGLLYVELHRQVTDYGIYTVVLLSYGL